MPCFLLSLQSQVWTMKRHLGNCKQKGKAYSKLWPIVSWMSSLVSGIVFRLEKKV